MAGTAAKTTQPDWDDWSTATTIVEESPQTVVFEEPGDEFVGIFAGNQHVEPENQNVDKTHRDYVSFDQWLFRDREGTLVAIPATFKLDQAMMTIPDGHMVRVQYIKDVPTGKGNPMKDFKVQSKPAA